jgi:hypothetical protein
MRAVSYAGFEDALRRVVTGDGADGRSAVIIDGAPSEIAAIAGLGGLLEIWTDRVAEPLDPRDATDRGKGPIVLSPSAGGVKVRWFVIEPEQPGISKDVRDKATRERFGSFGAEHHITDQTRHSAMHETPTLDIICLISGEASLILEDGETRLKPGQIVIQRATNHAWVAHGGPALFLAVLIDRPAAH